MKPLSPTALALIALGLMATPAVSETQRLVDAQTCLS